MPPQEHGTVRHIAFIGGTSEPGGIHIHTADVAQACAAVGHRVTIVCTSTNYYESLITDERVTIVVVPRLRGLSPYKWVSVWRSISKSCRGADLVFCNGEFGQTRLIDLVAARFLGRRVYTIDHRPWEGKWTSALPRGVFGGLSGAIVHRSIGVSNEITQAAISDFSFPAMKLATCLNWVSPGFTQRSESEREEARAAIGVTSGTTVVGYLGRLAPEKRIDALLRAFAASTLVENAILLVGGDGWKKKSLIKQARKLGIERQVRFTGWTRDPRPFLAACDLVVLPSLVEGFPLSLMEAMAVGCVCVAHPMPSTRELIVDGTNGVLADLSRTDSFAEALTRGVALAGHQDLGRRAAHTIVSRFSRERRLPVLLEALDSPLGAQQVPTTRPRALSFDAP